MHRPLRTAAIVAAMVALVPASASAVSTPSPKPHILGLADVNTDAPGDLCGAAAADPVPDGEDIVVSLPPGPVFTVGKIPASWWKTPPYGDAGWQLHLRGMSWWVNPLAKRAAQDGQSQSLATIVAQVLAFHAADPDPGTSTAATTKNANAWGWDEGTALRRLTAENCLYSLTKDARLVPKMAADVAVQYGPRFYGPPLHPVHNHGVMADIAIIHAAELLGRTDWLNHSITRLSAAAPVAWSPAGLTKEQSSGYDLVNVHLWSDVATAIAAHRGSAAAQQVSAIVDKAVRAVPWLTEPDGRITVYGDGHPDTGSTRSTWAARLFRDDVAGLAIGRWSWASPATTYFAVRYGPTRFAHGHLDRAALTWSTLGKRILVNPGQAPYDPAGAFRAWVISPAAANTASADGRAFKDAPVALVAHPSAASWINYTTADTFYGIKHTRKMTVANAPHWARIEDAYPKGVAFHQTWHLDPSWVLTKRAGTTLTFTSGARTLTMTTNGRAVSVVRGSMSPVAGWWFPTSASKVAAVQVSVAAVGAAMTAWTIT